MSKQQDGMTLEQIQATFLRQADALEKIGAIIEKKDKNFRDRTQAEICRGLAVVARGLADAVAEEIKEREKETHDYPRY